MLGDLAAVRSCGNFPVQVRFNLWLFVHKIRTGKFV